MGIIKKKRVIIYCRVSSDEQRSNTSLGQQERDIRAFAEKRQYIIDKVYKEDHSAKDFERPQWQDMLTYMKRNKSAIDSLLFYDYTRFSRNTSLGFHWHTYLLKNLNIEPQSITQLIDYNIPEYVYTLGIYLSGPQVDNVWRSIKTKNGMIARMQEGTYVHGRLPIGYTRAGKSAQVEHTNDARLIAMAFDMIYHGHSVSEMATRMRAMGIDRGVKAWHKTLRNTYYKGVITNSLLAEPVQATNMMPIVAASVFDRVQDILSGTQRSRASSIDVYALRGFCKCGSCGAELSGYQVNKKQRRGGGYIDKKTIIHYYICNNRKCRTNYSTKKMHEDFTGLIDSFRIDPDLMPVVEAQLTKVLTELNKKTVQANKHLRSRITETKKRIKSLTMKYIDGAIDADTYQDMKYELAETLLQCERLLTPELTVSNPTKQAKILADKLCKMGEVWSEGSIADKNKVQRVVFPEGVSYIKEKREYRTPRVNSIMELISANRSFKTTNAELFNKENPGIMYHSSPMVTSIEPFLNDVQLLLSLCA